MILKGEEWQQKQGHMILNILHLKFYKIIYRHYKSKVKWLIFYYSGFDQAWTTNSRCDHHDYRIALYNNIPVWWGNKRWLFA